MDLSPGLLAAVGFGIINFMLISASCLVYAERKISAFIQNRPGPNRVGPGGFFQPFADVFKLVFKEDTVPEGASKFVHSLAPVVMVVIAMTVPALIPYARGIVIVDSAVGVLIILALTSISVYGVTLAGWSSNSKFSLLGGLRSSAQMISYELSMGLAVASVVITAGSLSVVEIVEDQSMGGAILGWNFFRNPIGAILFIITAFAETNRAPFDLPEAEQELVGGYHTEYSGMKFGMFFLAEYVNWFVASFVIATFFFGGYLIPFEPQILAAFPGLEGSILLPLMQVGSLLIKVAFFGFLFLWVRWTLPRFKYSQLMQIGWKVLLPVALANVLLMAIVVAIFS